MVEAIASRHFFFFYTLLMRLYKFLFDYLLLLLFFGLNFKLPPPRNLKFVQNRHCILFYTLHWRG